MSWAELAAMFSALAAVIGVAITSLLTVGRIGRMAGIMETTLLTQNVSIVDLKVQMGKLSEVVTQLAVQKSEHTALQTQVTMLAAKIEELAHGEGFVFPLNAHLSKVRS